jgi:hypothetical protein
MPAQIRSREIPVNPQMVSQAYSQIDPRNDPLRRICHTHYGAPVR